MKTPHCEQNDDGRSDAKSIAGNFDHSFDKIFRGFLRDVVADALEDSVRVFTRELLAIRCSVRGRTVEITGNGDCRHSDHRSFGKPPFPIVVLWLAGSQALPPAVIMDHDVDMIRVVK